MSFLGEDQVEVELDQMLQHVDAGGAPRGNESKHVDVKQVPTGPDGTPERRIDALARFLWPHLACMSNTPGGGAIVLGVADDGQHLGARFDPEPVRARVHEISDRHVTPDVREGALSDDTPVQVWRVVQGVQLISVNGRTQWRTHDRCVDVDPSTWHATAGRGASDWSRELSTIRTAAADEEAIAYARRLLATSGDPARAALADTESAALLRALPNATGGRGDLLTNAGRLLFTPIDSAIHYLHRPVSGEAPDVDLRPTGPLLLQLRDVFAQFDARVEVTEVAGGPTVQRYQHLPARSAREAVLNGVVHRDWTTPHATVIEHIGSLLRVTSPGGFPPAVRGDRLLTGPSRPRYHGLAELTARLTLTDRAGNGIDLMWTEAVRAGRPIPTVAEHPDPSVVATIAGGPPDLDWIEMRRTFEIDGLNDLLAVSRTFADGFVTAATLARDIQDTQDVAEGVLHSLEHVLIPVAGQPAHAPKAWTLGDELRSMFPLRVESVVGPGTREVLFLRFVDATGRLSTTEASSLTGVGANVCGAVLKELWSRGELEPSNAGGRGHANYFRRPRPGTDSATTARTHAND